VPKKSSQVYAARLDIDYPDRLNRLTTFFRPILVIPIAIILSLLSSGLWFATLLMLVFRALAGLPHAHDDLVALRVHDPLPETLHVDTEHPGDPVGVYAPEVGLDQGIGEQRRVLLAHPDLLENLLCPAPQPFRREQNTAVNTWHVCSAFLFSHF